MLLFFPTGQNIPDVVCDGDSDCDGWQWAAPLPQCVSFSCRCPEGTCVIYTLSSSEYLYYCGDCGTLGSQCNDTLECNEHWVCSNGFCKCKDGFVYRELCVTYQPLPTSVSSVVLIVILAALLLAQKLISSRKAIKKCFSRSSEDSEEETRVVGYNPESNNKTAAFTVANSDFMATSDDPDLELALELSRRFSPSGADWLLQPTSTWSTISSSTTSRPNMLSSNRGSSQPGPSGLRTRLSSLVSNRSSNSSLSPCHRSTHLSISSSSSTLSEAPSILPYFPSRPDSNISTLSSHRSTSTISRSSRPSAFMSFFPSLTSHHLSVSNHDNDASENDVTVSRL
ncbi:uncharacterized protein [Cherax quadricarinatus]|uniref:uncharacterized protein n=1 Tax=Cherax quadricarinatus TaxID=27406 RepID=UPI00387E3B86